MRARGIVVGPLTAAQRVQRLLYLAGKAQIDTLDGYVRKDEAPPYCEALYYLLKLHNGGQDPTARDPATRWRKPGSSTVNRTCDCIGAQAWAGGWDRWQPVRFEHIYEGWINTDSMRMDAGGPAKCFIRLDRPELGCMVVFASGAGGHKVGHIGGLIGVPAEWDPNVLECWQALRVVDVAARSGRANLITSGSPWFGKDSWFVRSIMTP